MAFLLYTCASRGDGSRTFTRIGATTLVGNRGPITCYLHKHGNGGWHMPEEELLRRCAVEPADHALIVDLNPQGSVSLYRLKDVWGYSSEVWTPLALRLEPLFVNRIERNPKEFKQEFHDCDFDRDAKIVHEFLYLLKRKDVWQWGRTGSVNAAVLPPGPFTYFLKEILAQDEPSRGFPLEALGVVRANVGASP